MSGEGIAPALGSYLCAACATRFEAPILGDFDYGEFLMWSPNGEVRYLAAIVDPAYKEFSALVRTRHPAVALGVVADLIQRNFGRLACDPDSRGSPFSIAGPYCPHCGGTSIDEQEVFQPLRRAPEIPHVLHAAWNRLSADQKMARMMGQDGATFFRRDDVTPEWEPIPYALAGAEADAQELGFYRRSIQPIAWKRVPILDFPAEGILGQPRDWFRSRDVDYYAQADGEDLILWENIWPGFPDPPRWGLASRDSRKDGEWQVWGHFPDLPERWILPAG